MPGEKSEFNWSRNGSCHLKIAYNYSDALFLTSQQELSNNKLFWWSSGYVERLAGLPLCCVKGIQIKIAYNIQSLGGLLFYRNKPVNYNYNNNNNNVFIYFSNTSHTAIGSGLRKNEIVWV